MSWIKEINEQDADSELKEMYDDIIKSRGKVSNIMKVHSLAPSSMKAHMDLYLEVVFKRPGLSRAEREMLGTYVSRLNGCSYCMDHHGVALQKYWKDERKVEKLKTGNPKGLGLNSKEIALLDYAEVLTKVPGSMAEENVQMLRDAGLAGVCTGLSAFGRRTRCGSYGGYTRRDRGGRDRGCHRGRGGRDWR